MYEYLADPGAHSPDSRMPRTSTVLTLAVGGCLLVGAASLPAQPPALVEPDTSAEERIELPTPEPPRQVRRLDGTQRLVALRYDSARDGVDLFGASLPALTTFLNQEVRLPETAFRAEEHDTGSYDFGDARLVVLTGNTAIVDMSRRQKQRLGDYLKRGGLLYGEDVRPVTPGGSADVGQAGTPFDRRFKDLIEDPHVLGVSGRRWQRVGKDHPLFTAYFEFPDGPPQSGTARRRSTEPRVTELEMLELRGRVVVIYSDLNISPAWANPESVGRQQSLRFGANLVLFALAQYATAAP
jgi:hypothetical protein